jgi:uncharacterized protein (DUF2384 family)
VKANDATEMERILADDFVLVTGRGASYTKAVLLASASSRRSHEHQEELRRTQTVRVWGDAAVVTAAALDQGNAGRPVV